MCLLEETRERLVDLDCLGVRVRYGGDLFKGPVLVDSKVLNTLSTLTPQAPLHLPGTITLIHACQAVFPGIPVYLFFDTALFADMPDRESMYGISSKLAHEMKFRRFGFQGLYHQSAYRYAVRQSRRDQAQPAAKIISICLEPNPEVSALTGGYPVFVTGGITPMEGLPSETGCGDIDPGIILSLSERTGWGPERLNRVLSKESGLLALAGHPVTLEELYADTRPEYELAGQFFKYKLMHACGAATAAMGGVEALVFSGRYARTGRQLGESLTRALNTAMPSSGSGIPFYLCEEALAVSMVRALLPRLSR
jgi:acetate kinase